MSICNQQNYLNNSLRRSFLSRSDFGLHFTASLLVPNVRNSDMFGVSQFDPVCEMLKLILIGGSLFCSPFECAISVLPSSTGSPESVRKARSFIQTFWKRRSDALYYSLANRKEHCYIIQILKNFGTRMLSYIIRFSGSCDVLSGIVFNYW